MRHRVVYWLATVILAFLTGMAIMQGVANKKVYDDAGWKCKQQLVEQSRRQSMHPSQ